jgi:hypothetical protein
MTTQTIQKLTSIRNLAAACFTVVTLTAGLTSTAQAQCGPSKNIKMHTTVQQHPSLMAAAAARPNLIVNPISIPNPVGPSIVGLWQITFSVEGQVVDEGFDAWHSDSTEVLNDTPPPSTGNVCLGVWAQTTGNTFKLYHPSWTFDPAGNLNGTAIIRETVTLSSDNKTFTGTFSLDEYDLQNNLLFHVDGDIAATRITVQ